MIAEREALLSINQSVVSMVWWFDPRNFRFSLFSSAVRPRIGSTTFFRRRREFMDATTTLSCMARAPIMFVQPSHSRASAAARDFKFAGFPSCAIFMANDAVKRAFCSFPWLPSSSSYHEEHAGSMHSSSLASGSSPDTFTNDSSSKLAPLADT